MWFQSTISLQSHSPAVIICYFEYKKKGTVERWRDKATGSQRGSAIAKKNASEREPSTNPSRVAIYGERGH